VQALIENNFTHFSSQVELDPRPYNQQIPPPIWRFPIGAATNDLNNDDYNSGIPASATLAQIRFQLNVDGFAAVMVTDICL
jgi:hypothetical protein